MNPLTMAKQLQKTFTMDSALTGQQRKKLAIWFITSILALMKHGDVTDELTPDEHVTGDLRPLRTGDPFKMQFASATSAVGQGSWILTNDESKQVFYSIIDSCTKNNHKTPPLTVPVHERCPLLAGFLLQWRKLMCTYQNTEEPFLLCTMSLDAAKRTPLFKTGDSRSILKWNSDTVRNYDQRVWLSSGIDGPHDTTRTASARRTRAGPNRSHEMLHNKSQEINYQSDGKRARVAASGSDIEADSDVSA
jgi:hypothetical protein